MSILSRERNAESVVFGGCLRGKDMDLKGKKVFILGERDGVQAQSIVNSLKTTEAEIVYIDTQCFV